MDRTNQSKACCADGCTRCRRVERAFNVGFRRRWYALPDMAGFERLRGAVCVLLASASLLSCRGASAPVPDARNSGDARTPSPVQLKVGDQAPEFSLPASDGRVYSLASYRGKQAVVLAWIAKAFTGP